MKTFLALLTAVGGLGGGLLLVKINGLMEEIGNLERQLGMKASRETVETVSREHADGNAAGVKQRHQLEGRIAQLESALRDAGDKKDAKPSLAFASLREEVDDHSEAIDSLRARLERTGRTNSAINKTADRLLSAVGQASGEDDGERGEGLERLFEFGNLVGKRPEDLTEEERAKREELTARFRDRQVDWTLRGFDRSLEVKLSDDQKQSLGAFIAEENRELSGLRDQGLDREARSARQKEIRARTDQQIGGVLSTEQQESWTKYRSRSGRGRGWDRIR